MIRRLIVRARLAVVDFICWIDGDRTGLSDWARQHLTPDLTPEDQAVIDQLRAMPTPEPDVDPALLERMRAEIVAAGQAEAARNFGQRVDAMRRAWPPVPAPPPVPRPREPRIAGGVHGYGLVKDGTVAQDLACVDRLDLSPARKQWLKARIRGGAHLWDVLAEDDWEPLGPGGAA